MQPKEIMQERKRSQLEQTSGSEIINMEYPDQVDGIGGNLPPTTRQALYKHVFSWSSTDMVGVDKEVIEHKLMIKPGAKEIK